MRALVQRIAQAEVAIGEDVIGKSGPGLLILVCAMQGDDAAIATSLAAKIAKLRVFKDEGGKMNRALLDTGGSALVVSQFTLAADTRRGNRPGFSAAATPTEGEALYIAFADALQAQGIGVETGSFGADMQVSLVNDGPVTIWLDTDAT
ncbi:D-aminoacyl-tRNA deacylase [Tropicimonas sp. S265A]|uniref:D-aminoacyl-tRNA deacylase n=1 Tax=Tropicimonas sp. S265A TaxID=3415134 RepID=UPI003C7BF140